MRLTKNQRLDWSRDGFLRIESFFNIEEIKNLLDCVEAIESCGTVDAIHHYEKTHDGIKPSRTENFIHDHEGFQKLFTTGKILDAVSELFGEKAVLYKEKLNYKYPGGGAYIAHQDAPAYDYVKYHITCLVAVDQANERNGCLQFASGLHDKGLIGLDSNGCIQESIAQKLEWKPVPLDPGDILLFSSYTPHKSDGNKTTDRRRIVYLTYNALSAGDFRQQYYATKIDAIQSKSTGKISKIGHFQGKTVNR